MGDPSTLLMQIVQLAVLGLQLFAVVDALFRPGPAFVAAGKLTKPAWVAILVVSILASGLPLIGLFAVVAAIVYLVDVRPAVRGLRPGGPWA